MVNPIILFDWKTSKHFQVFQFVLCFSEDSYLRSPSSERVLLESFQGSGAILEDRINLPQSRLVLGNHSDTEKRTSMFLTW